MNLMEALHVWRRRWILTSLLLLVALAGAAGAAMKLPRHYQAESTVVLLPSASTSKSNGHNPYLTFNSSLPLTAQIISYQLMDPHTVQNLAGQGYTETYTAALAANAAGPILQVLVTGSDKSAVERTLHGVTDEIGTKLAALQNGITSANQITVMTLSVDPHPSLSISKTARPLVVVLGFGLALALAIPLIVDGRSVRRRNSVPAAPAAGTEMDGPDGGAVPAAPAAGRKMDGPDGGAVPAAPAAGRKMDGPDGGSIPYRSSRGSLTRQSGYRGGQGR
jgi:capsular polysaccharide biosynthesis protein